MKIVNNTELMANQKASTIIVPDKQFEALQTIEGKSLLFSIGTDNILYCTREVSGDTHGWVQVNLSTSLSASVYGGAAVVAKTFDIAQDLSSVNTVDIALVVTVNGTDYLHLATGFANTFDNWTSSTPTFTQYPYDDYAHPAYAGSPINEVQIVDGNGNQFIIADLITNTTTQTISRYFIDPTESLYTNPTTGAGCAWVPHNLSIDLQAGSIHSYLGCGPDDGPNGAGNDIGGIYVLGTITGKAQLMYAPAFNFYNPEMQQNPTIFNLPSGTNSAYMAMALSAPGDVAPYTDLFFASGGSLYFLANADQVDSATTDPTPQLIYTHALFNNIQSIQVSNWNDNIVLWGQSLNPDGTGTSQLFIMEGVAGQETNASSWSCPVLLLTDVVNSSAYVNNTYSLDSSINSQTGNAYGSVSVLFAQQVINQVSSFTQLFQDPVTSAWQARSLLTAPTAENIMTEIYDTTTYSTHIEITDDNNIVQPGLAVAVWASSPCTVYVSDANNSSAYQTLDTVTPLLLTSDVTGNIAIMQPVDTIGGISYYVAVEDPTTKQAYTEAINPLANTLAALNNKVPNGNSDYLQGVQVSDEYGNSTLLVPTANNGQTANTSNQINTICQQSSNLSADGLVTGQSWPDAAVVAAAFSAAPVASVPALKAPFAPASGKPTRVKHPVPLAAANSRVKKMARQSRLAKDIRLNPQTDKIWAWKYGDNAAHYEGVDALTKMGFSVQADGSLAYTAPTGAVLGSSDWIETKAGDLFKWMQNEADKLENVLISFANGVIDCVLTIAGSLYHFVAKCANDIVNLVHTVLNAIETAFGSIVQWIGMIFNFQDILRTHNVMSNLFTVYFNNCITNVSGLSAQITTAFGQLEGQIDKATGLPTTPIPASADTLTYQGGMASSTPVAGSKSPSANYGIQHTKNNGQNAQSSYTPVALDDSIFDSLLQLVQNEGTAFTDAGNQIKAIAANVNNQTATETVTQLMAVVVDLLLNTAENMLQEMVTILETLLTGVMDAITYELDVPVLTYLYMKMTKSTEYPDGNNLTALDLGCLVSSFFTTIVYKAVKGAAPFPAGDLTDAMISATDMPSLQLAIANFQSGSGTTPGLLGHDSDDGMTTWNMVTSIVATAGAIFTDWALIVRSNIPYLPNGDYDPVETKNNKFFTMLSSVSYWAYVSPDILSAVGTYNVTTAEWYDTMNNLCTYLGVAKSLVDFTSWKWSGTTYGQFVGPALDFILNVAWQVPSTAQFIVNMEGAENTWPNAIVSFIGGTAFDMSGIYSPVYAEAYYLQPPSIDQKAAVNASAGIISVLNLVWGASCLVTTFDQLPIPS